MTRIKLILLSMVAVLGISAVASVASAAAAEPLTRYSVEGIGEITTALNLTASVGTAQLNGFILGSKIMIECTNNTLKNGQIEPEGKSKGEISFTGCTLFVIKSTKESQAVKCEVKVPTFSYTDLLVRGPGGLIEDEFKPTGAENTFVTVEVLQVSGQNCLLKGNFKAKGSYVASLGAEGEVLKKLHELLFTSTGSKLTFGNEPASFTNHISVELEDLKSWLVG